MKLVRTDAPDYNKRVFIYQCDQLPDHEDLENLLENLLEDAPDLEWHVTVDVKCNRAGVPFVKVSVVSWLI